MTNCVLPEEFVSRNGSDNHIELQKENMENISSKSDLLVSKHCIESHASTCYSSIDDPGELSQENIEEASSDSSIIPLGNRISSRKKHHPPEEDFSPCAIISDSSNELRNENLNDESVLTEQASQVYMTQHHADEKAVQDYLSFPKTTKDGRQMRREILALLRYESDFKIFVQNENPSAERLPCAHCKRIIGVNYLRRHYKKCIAKPINETGRNICHRAASQTLVACASDHGNVAATLRVKQEVFSRMASDEIGYLARRDPLIRHFGGYYLKKHKRAQIITACSNKMRECARLLIELRRRIGKADLSFFELLNPTLFDNIISSSKSISGYDEEKKSYRAPSLAMHMGTTLQQICELTTNLLLKKSSDLKCDDYEMRLKK
nr:unnamed protein product [Callosobruchus analis]